MVEIAICLAVIGFALVAIIGVLPIGMSVQKDNREQTVINFDANYLMNALRNGAIGQDNLTNFVYSISITSSNYNSNGVAQVAPFSIYKFTPTNTVLNGQTNPFSILTNGTIIMGLMGTPKYIPLANGFTSNNVSVDFRSISGSALDQGTNQTSRDFAFTYRVTIENTPSGLFPFAIAGNVSAPLDAVTNELPAQVPAVVAAWNANNKFVQDNLHEIRLQYRWPILPNGLTPPANRLIYRTTAGGQLVVNPSYAPAIRIGPNRVQLYFLNPQSYAP